MLEHAIIASSDKKKRILVLPISIGAHILLIAVAVWAGVWNVGVPENPPAQGWTLVIGVAPAIPPPAPPPPAEPAQSDPQPVQQTPVEPVTPTIVPFEVPDIPVTPVTGGETGAGERGGEPGGVEGGTPGGVVGGEPGGMLGGGGTGQGDGPLVVGGDVKAPVTIRRVDPEYPRPAQLAGIQGTVVMRCVIDRQGRIRSAEVHKAVHPILDAAALAAVRQWRFRPGTLNGQPVDVIFHLTVNFSLERQ